MRSTLCLLIAVFLYGCAEPRLEGYDVILCSGDSIYSQIGLNTNTAEYGAFDFRSGFDYCSTENFHCLKAPLVLSAPRDLAANGFPDSIWVVEGIKFEHVENDSGFQIIASRPASAIFKETKFINKFSEGGYLMEVRSSSSEGESEVQKVCQGRLKLNDIFE